MARYPTARVILVLLAAVALVGSAAVGSGAPARSPPGFDPDSVLLRVDVQPDGSAEWRVEYRLELATPNESAAFESLREDIESNPRRYEARFEGLLGSTVRKAENVTSRRMALRGTDVSASRRAIPKETGVVAYTFTWTAFAEREGDRLLVGDSLSGLPLDEETTLQLTWPETHEPASIRPGPAERRRGVAVWTGPTTFAADEPRLRLAPRSTPTPEPTPSPTPSPTATTAPTTGTAGAATSPTATTTAPVAPGGDSPATSGRNQIGADRGAGGPLSGLMPVAGVAVIATVGAVGWLVRNGEEGAATGATGTAGSAAPADDDGGSTDAAAGDGPDTDAAGAAGAGDAGEDGPPPELLSPEERVLSALEANDGRMKQAELSERLDWSAPKTSRVVGDLRDEGTVSVFRLGRENVVTLPEEEL